MHTLGPLLFILLFIVHYFILSSMASTLSTGTYEELEMWRLRASTLIKFIVWWGGHVINLKKKSQIVLDVQKEIKIPLT